MKDYSKILDTVVKGIDFIPTKELIVKPLKDEYVKKEITKPINTGKKDEHGYEINDSETVKEKVLTTFKKGIVLKVPSGYQWPDNDNHPEVGDVVCYARKHAIDFDLFKDSQLVNPYNVVAYIKGDIYFKD